MSVGRKKWNTDDLPDGYASECDTGQLKNVIQDLNDEYVTKTKGGKNNIIWERLILQLIKSGHDELEQRKQFDKKKPSWFSMDNPIIYIIVTLILAMVAYFAYTHKWPLKFIS